MNEILKIVLPNVTPTVESAKTFLCDAYEYPNSEISKRWVTKQVLNRDEVPEEIVMVEEVREPIMPEQLDSDGVIITEVVGYEYEDEEAIPRDEFFFMIINQYQNAMYRDIMLRKKRMLIRNATENVTSQIDGLFSGISDVGADVML